jgi:hypothetical protein
LINRGFRHLDPSSTKIYQSTVIYGFETDTLCLMIKVKNGYVVETPPLGSLRWIRGQHIEILKPFFSNIIALRMCQPDILTTSGSATEGTYPLS